MGLLTVTKIGGRKAFRRRVHEDGAGPAFNWLRHEGTNYAERAAAFRRIHGKNTARYYTLAGEVAELALAWAGDMRGVPATVADFKMGHGL